MRRCVDLLICCALAACTGTPTERPAPATSVAAFAADEFEGAAALLDGFDERTDDAEWQAHDRALFGLRLDRGGEVTRWLLLLEAPHGQHVGKSTLPDGSEAPVSIGEALFTWKVPVASTGARSEVEVRFHVASVRVRVFTASGEPLTDTDDLLPVELLGHGLLPAIDAARQAAGGTPVNELPMVEGVLAVQRLLEIVQGNEALADYFWQVIDKPSLWSALTHFGVDVNVSVPLEQSVPADAPAPIPRTEPTFVVPMRIDVNGSPALFIDLMAADSRRPFALCGGIVAAVARHPTESHTTLRMQLLAARCGSVTGG